MKAGLVFAFVGSAAAHGNLIRIEGQRGTAVKTEGNEGIFMRTGVSRTGTTVSGDIPGIIMDRLSCDHCVMENRPYLGDGPPNVLPGWWVSRPGGHWDDERVWPETTPCMSEDSFGERGILELIPGEVLDTTFYINADHGGFYRFELAKGREPSNAEFMDAPISPFYSLHETLETPGHVYPERVIGWSKNETDLYIDRMYAVGFELGDDRLNQQSFGQSSEHCQNNYVDCFLDDKVVVPTDTPPGEYVLRWNWFSLETPQVYVACSDIVIN